jgi:hypothetical protein
MVNLVMAPSICCYTKGSFNALNVQTTLQWGECEARIDFSGPFFDKEIIQARAFSPIEKDLNFALQISMVGRSLMSFSVLFKSAKSKRVSCKISLQKDHLKHLNRNQIFSAELFVKSWESASDHKKADIRNLLY